MAQDNPASRASKATPPLKLTQHVRSSVYSWIMKLVLVYVLVLVVRHFFHGDAPYFSVYLMMPVFKWAASIFQVLLGYKPTIIGMFEVLGCFLCVSVGFNVTPRVVRAIMNRPPEPAADRAARSALTKSLIVLFVITPAIYFAASYLRTIANGQNPYDKPQGLLGSAPSVKLIESSYMSNRVVSGNSAAGQLVLCVEEHCVTDVPEEEYQREKAAAAPSTPSSQASKSAPSTPSSVVPSKPKAADKNAQKSSSNAVVAVDIQSGQDLHAYSVMKDLGKMQFLVFCGISLVMASVGSFFI